MKKIITILFFIGLFALCYSKDVYADSQNTTTEASTEKTTGDSYEADVPIGNVKVIPPAQAPSMDHADYDKEGNPAQAVYDTMLSVLTKYKTIVVGLAGLIDLFLIGVVIFRFIKLGNCPKDNANERRSAISALAISLFSVAVMGSLTLWYSLFFNALH